MVIKEVEAVVVGGGVHGASAAYHLAKAGRHVVLVEKKNIGAGSSGTSGGIVRCHYSNEAMVRLALRAAELWPDLEAKLGHPVDYVKNGFIAAVTADDSTNMERIVHMQQRLGVDTELLPIHEIGRWIPEFQTEGLALAAYEAKAGYADPYATAVAFGKRAQELGAEIVRGVAVTGIDMDGPVVQGVVTEQGLIRTALVVNCAGPWAARVARMVGVEIPVHPSLLQMVAFNPHYPGWARTSPTWVDMSTMTYCRPDSMGYMLAGGGLAENEALTDEEIDPDTCPARPPVLFEAEIHDNLVNRCPWAKNMSRVRSWTGPDGGSPDFHLIFGPVPGVRGYLQVVGGSGNSFKLSPATGEAVAEYVTTGQCSYLDVNAFSITRFSENRQFRSGYQMHITA